ncbi:Protein of unknown function [Cotesia congregata]|uniref:Uncharacterized protein n=1 Tax=Cotesia congregata TaxID=51543 RepID=A0A8J2MND2_COTCN|nr:Protein of unknown function [Cotesia congregata]
MKTGRDSSVESENEQRCTLDWCEARRLGSSWGFSFHCPPKSDNWNQQGQQQQQQLQPFAGPAGSGPHHSSLRGQLATRMMWEVIPSPQKLRVLPWSVLSRLAWPSEPEVVAATSNLDNTVRTFACQRVDQSIGPGKFTYN